MANFSKLSFSDSSNSNRRKKKIKNKKSADVNSKSQTSKNSDKIFMNLTFNVLAHSSKCWALFHKTMKSKGTIY